MISESLGIWQIRSVASSGISPKVGHGRLRSRVAGACQILTILLGIAAPRLVESQTAADIQNKTTKATTHGVEQAPAKNAPNADKPAQGAARVADATSKDSDAAKSHEKAGASGLISLIQAGVIVGVLALWGSYLQARQVAKTRQHDMTREAKLAETYRKCLAVDLKILSDHLKELLWDLEDLADDSSQSSSASKKVMFVPIADTIQSSWDHLSFLEPSDAEAVRLLSGELTQLTRMLEKFGQQGEKEQLQSLTAFVMTVSERVKAIKV